MSQSLQLKVSTRPVFIIFTAIITGIVVLFGWLHYQQQKQQAIQTVTQTLNSQKLYFDNLLAPALKTKNRRQKAQKLNSALEQINDLWTKEALLYPQIGFRLYDIQNLENKEISIERTPAIISAGQDNEQLFSISQNLPEFANNEAFSVITQPLILQKSLTSDANQYQITVLYRFSSVADFIMSIAGFTLLALIGAISFIWMSLFFWKKYLQNRIEQTQERYDQFVQNANDWLWELNAHGVITFCSSNTSKILGYQTDELIGKPLYNFLYEKTAEKDQQNLNIYFENKAHIANIKVHFASSKGTPVLLRLNAEPIKDKNDKLLNYRGTGTDLTEMMQKQDSMISMTLFDSLTQLPNRTNLISRLDDHLNQVMQRKDMILSALIFIDLDDFKDINNIQGQDGGNQLLTEIANRLSTLVNNKEIVYRLSGDEFVILIISPNKMLMNEFKVKLEVLVNEILMTINRPYVIDEHNVLITASAGITLIPQDGRSSNELFAHGESAIAQAKKNGKNRLCYFDASMRELEIHRKHMVKQIKKATENDEFTLHYQMQVNSKTNEIYGMEALIRWPNGTKDNINPNDFIQLAVESNHIQAIDEWVIRQATKDLEQFHKATDRVIPVSINLSSKTVENPQLKTMLIDALEKHSLSPEDIRIEITETGLLKNIDQTVQALSELKALGFQSNIDDFGTGYSSLSYLQQLPIDVLKIDKSFIDGIANNPKDLQICQSIINLGKTLNKTIIAEGVQTVQQKDLLLAEGCHIIQGYYYYRPAPIKDVIIASAGKKISAKKKSAIELRPSLK